MLSNLQIQMHANSFREIAGIPLDEPIGDIKKIITSQDYVYSEKPLPKGYAAESKIENSEFHIAFNSDIDYGEKFHRFTMGHELGHWNIPTHFEKLQEIKLHRSSPEYQSPEEIEREADKFSIYFLAPEIAYRKQMVGKPFSISTIDFLADHFNISQYAAVLHFIEITDLTCSLAVCNENFEIEWECRSNNMRNSYKMQPLKKRKLSDRTMVYDCIKKRQSSEPVTTMMSDWYNDFPHKMECTEAVLRLDYNKKYLTFITPEWADLNEFMESNGIDSEGNYLNSR
jgi:Zn-dependent peptidase ImmA (M78 family)